MANERGLLPKARREDLDERLTRRLERWYENAYADDNLFLTMARRTGLFDATWGFIRYIYGGGSSVEPELAELVRIRLAFTNECVH
jgi:hypothetical protein